AGNVGSSTAVSFTVSNSTTPPPAGTFAEVEANDTVATANAVAKTYSAIKGNITVSTDKDYFGITLNAGEKIAIAMTGPTGVDWDLKLVNAAGTQLAISQGSTATESVTYTNTGTTAMTVYANTYVYSGTSTTPYNLALTYSGGSSTTNTVTASITTPSSNVTIASGTSQAFAGTATDSSSTATLTYAWTFGDGGTATGATASHTYTNTGSTSVTYTATLTATDNTGVKGTATRTITVSPASGGTTTELVANGGFESGATSWTGTTGDIGTFTGEPAHAGSYDAWLLGNGTTATESLSQAISIPSTITKATLTFWMHIDTAETTTTSAYDTMKVQVISGTTTTTLATYSNLNKNTGFAQMTFDLSAYKGQAVTLKFLGSEDSSLQTSFVIDDVSVKIQ
ncbi:MAG TPA: PKD domain-containing protein, partial [Geothrix sp.]|nr:PKD domain-containing protein [Geothrix sp.]